MLVHFHCLGRTERVFSGFPQSYVYYIVGSLSFPVMLTDCFFPLNPPTHLIVQIWPSGQPGAQRLRVVVHVAGLLVATDVAMWESPLPGGGAKLQCVLGGAGKERGEKWKTLSKHSLVVAFLCSDIDFVVCAVDLRCGGG